MRPFVKICGITNLADALFCAAAGADALGFIFYKKSPRYIEPSEAGRIISHLSAVSFALSHTSSSITPIGVFVNEDREAINRIVSGTKVKIIQLSGDESPADCSGYDVGVWKAFRIRNEFIRQFPIAAALLDGADKLSYGGSGIPADYTLATEIKKHHRLILAGGLNPGNILDAIHAVQPFGVDLNSGIEIAPGKKDHKKVTQLFNTINKGTKCSSL